MIADHEDDADVGLDGNSDDEAGNDGNDRIQVAVSDDGNFETDEPEPENVISGYLHGATNLGDTEAS